MTAAAPKLMTLAAALTLVTALPATATPAPRPAPALVQVDVQVLQARDGAYVIAAVTSLFGLELEGELSLMIDGQRVMVESIDTRGQELVAYKLGRLGGMHVACAELDGVLHINGDATRQVAAEDCGTAVVALIRAPSAAVPSVMISPAPVVSNPALKLLDRREQRTIRQ